MLMFRENLCSQKFMFAKYNVLIGISQHFPLGTKITLSRFKIKCSQWYFLWFWTSGDFFDRGDFCGAPFSCHRCRQFALLPPSSSYTGGYFLVLSSCGRLLHFLEVALNIKIRLAWNLPSLNIPPTRKRFPCQKIFPLAWGGGGFRRRKEDFKSLLGGEESLPD